MMPCINSMDVKEIGDLITENHQNDDNLSGHDLVGLLVEEVDISVERESLHDQQGNLLCDDSEVFYYGERIIDDKSFDRIKFYLLAMGWTECGIGSPTVRGWQKFVLPVLLSPKASSSPFAKLDRDLR